MSFNACFRGRNRFWRGVVGRAGRLICRKLKHEIVRKPLAIAANLFVESLGWHAVQLREVAIQDDILAANCLDERFDPIHQHELHVVCHFGPPIAVLRWARRDVGAHFGRGHEQKVGGVVICLLLIHNQIVVNIRTFSKPIRGGIEGGAGDVSRGCA